VIPLLLDTCAAIWLSEKEPISDQAIAALNESVDSGTPIFVSVISSWEIGLLVARKRLPLSMDPLAWFERLLEISGVSPAEISPRILVKSSFLPGLPPKDPMDRIIISTAREGGFRLVTRDKHLLAYAGEGHINVLAC
jgi:PIN domain nuclease of toxin-antitoxin system